MTDQSRSVTVSLTLGTPIVGLWCETCLLPSRFTASIYVLGDDGPVEVGVINRCEDGDHE